MGLSTLNKNIILAYKKGYRVNKEGEVIGIKGNILKLSKYKNYYTFNIRDNKGKSTRVYVHKLQAYIKYNNSMFVDGIVVRHLDGNSFNNKLNNIKIGTYKDNSLDIPKKLRVLNASNPKFNHAKIIKDRSLGLSYLEIMDKYNITSKGTVSYIINKSLESK